MSAIERAHPDRRAVRREASKEQIVRAAWELVRAQGLAGLAMRDLGERVGMRAQSIYSYFVSKHEIYDAMFHEGYTTFTAAMAETVAPTDRRPRSIAQQRDLAHRAAHQFFDFCTSDPVRYQLLFQRTIPDFVPSPESWAVALEAFDLMRMQLASIGITDPEAIDMWTALLTGLTDQQISNDPGGDRWKRVVDRSVDMLLRDTAPHLCDATGTSPVKPERRKR